MNVKHRGASLHEDYITINRICHDFIELYCIAGFIILKYKHSHDVLNKAVGVSPVTTTCMYV